MASRRAVPCACCGSTRCTADAGMPADARRATRALRDALRQFGWGAPPDDPDAVLAAMRAAVDAGALLDPLPGCEASPPLHVVWRVCLYELARDAERRHGDAGIRSRRRDPRDDALEEFGVRATRLLLDAGAGLPPDVGGVVALAADADAPRFLAELLARWRVAATLAQWRERPGRRQRGQEPSHSLRAVADAAQAALGYAWSAATVGVLVDLGGADARASALLLPDARTGSAVRGLLKAGAVAGPADLDRVLGRIMPRPGVVRVLAEDGGLDVPDATLDRAIARMDSRADDVELANYCACQEAAAQTGAVRVLLHARAWRRRRAALAAALDAGCGPSLVVSV